MTIRVDMDMPEILDQERMTDVDMGYEWRESIQHACGICVKITAMATCANDLRGDQGGRNPRMNGITTDANEYHPTPRNLTQTNDPTWLESDP